MSGDADRKQDADHPQESGGSSARRSLRRLRHRLRFIGTMEVVLAGLAATLVVVLGLGLLDYVLRLPSWLRLLVMLLGLAALGLGVWTRLRPALRFKPSLTSLALRVERSAPGQHAGLQGVLASGIALGSRPAAHDPDAPAVITELSTLASEEADRRLLGIDPSRLVSLSLLRHHGLTALAAAGIAVAVTIASPSTSRIAAMRVLWPIGDTQWPSRYEVADATELRVHPIGSALPLRAVVTKTNRIDGETPVDVAYRITDAAGTRPVRRERLTFQFYDAQAGGEIYERLIELGQVTPTDADTPAMLTFAFETPDGLSQRGEVLLVEPPVIERVAAKVTPPAYASAAHGAGEHAWLDGSLPLPEAVGAGQLLGPVLAGSEIELELALNKPAELFAGDRIESVESATPIDHEATAAAADTLTLAWIADESARARLTVRDSFGLESLDEAVVRIDVQSDRPPTATVTTPPRDEAVLATAVIVLVGEGRDDVGLAGVSLETQRAVRPGGDEPSPGAAHEGVGQPETIATSEPGGLRREAAATIDLSTLGLRAGDELWVTAVATDIYALGGVTHEPVRSKARRLRIISERELIDELLAELGSVRRAAIRLDEQQAEVETELAESPPSEPASGAALRQQASVQEGIARAAEQIERAAERAARNGLRDDRLDRVFDEASLAADRAADAAERARQELGNAAQDGAPPEERRASREAADEASRDVRRALESLARTLDQGEDAWAVRRAIESLLEDQGRITEATAQAGGETVGRSLDRLSEEERSALDEIAQRQLELAERAMDVLDELDRSADEAEERDPGESAALRAASRRGRESGVASALQRASQSIAQNRSAEAGRAQQEAQEQLEEMLRDLDEAERQRDAELQRALLSLVESIEALIRTQEALLPALDDEDADDATIALNRNTLGVIDEASGAPETAAVADPLRDASMHQGETVLALRAEPAELAEADRTSRASLDDLRRALDIAQEELEDAERRELERRKRELQQAYRDLLTREVDIRQRAEPLTERRLSRRDRQDVRGLGASQLTIRDELAELPTTYPELADAGVFRFTHERLDDMLTSAGGVLESGRVTRGAAADVRSSIRLLQGLIEALDDPEPNDDDAFSQGSSGNGGQGQSGEPQLLPPLAELTLLRTLQLDLYEQTRAADEDGDASRAESLADQQRAVADHAAGLLERLQQDQPPSLESAPSEPTEEPTP